jgi:hypothetical protein
VDTEQDKQPQISDLPQKVDSPSIAADAAQNVKGGRARRGGDDDLDDLEVERHK